MSQFLISSAIRHISRRHLYVISAFKRFPKLLCYARPISTMKDKFGGIHVNLSEVIFDSEFLLESEISSQFNPA